MRLQTSKRLVAQAMAFLQQQQALILQVCDPDARLPGQAVVLRQRHVEILVVEFAAGQALDLDRQGEHADVDITALEFREHGGGLVLEQQQIKPGHLLAHRRRHLWQHDTGRRSESSPPATVPPADPGRSGRW